MTETFAGIALPGHLHTQESLGFAAAFTFRPSDVLIATYPKSGEGMGGHRDNEGTGRGWEPGLGRGLSRSCRGLGDTPTCPRGHPLAQHGDAWPGDPDQAPALLPHCPQPQPGVSGGSGRGDTALPPQPLLQEGSGWHGTG